MFSGIIHTFALIIGALIIGSVGSQHHVYISILFLCFV